MAKKKAAAPKKKRTVKKAKIRDGSVSEDAMGSWAEAAQNGFSAKYTGEESADVDRQIVIMYEDGVPLTKIATELKLSASSIRARFLKILLAEMYDTYYVDADTGEPIRKGDKEYGDWD